MRYLAVFIAALMVSHTALGKERANIFVEPSFVCDTNRCQLKMKLSFPDTHDFPIAPQFNFTATDCNNNTVASFEADYETIFPGTSQTIAVWQDFPPIPDDEVYGVGIWLTDKIDADFNKNNRNADLSVTLVGGEEKFGLPVWWSGCYERNN